MNRHTFRQSLLLLLTAVIWGVAFVAQSAGMDYVGPFTFNAVRSIIGGIVLIPCIYILKRFKNASYDKAADDVINAKDISEASERNNSRKYSEDSGKKNVGDNTTNSAIKNAGSKSMLMLGGIVCGIVLCIASNFQQIGIKYTTVGKAGFTTALYIIIVPILSIFLHKKAGFKVWLSVVIAVIGFYLLCISESLMLQMGDLLELLCALFFSVHILIIDYFSPKVDGVKMSCIQFFVCGIICVILMFVFEKPDISLILAAWKPILYAGVMSCGVGYTLQIIGQKGMNPTVASLILSMESVISALAGWVLLNQRLSVKEMCGCVLVFAAIILAQLPEKQKA